MPDYAKSFFRMAVASLWGTGLLALGAIFRKKLVVGPPA